MEGLGVDAEPLAVSGGCVAHKVTVILMVGGWPHDEMGQVLRRVHQAAARDLLECLLRQSEYVGRVVLATDDAGWAGTLSDLAVEIDLDRGPEPFVFGRRLAVLIEHYDAQRVLYSGGGSAPLMDAEQWGEVLEHLATRDEVVVANNIHSCDWVGFTRAHVLLDIVAQETHDNALAWVLSHEVGFPVETCEPEASTRFDLDTPIDLLIARRHAGVGPHLRSALGALDWTCQQLDDVISILGREGTSLAIAGRVSSAAWDAIDRATQCWIRVFAEERGMRASGRQARGEVRSLLADHLQLVGVDGFFEELAGLVDGVLLDNRVILAARGIWPSTADRYYADLCRWDRVVNPFLRRMTRAASEADVPVVMGGHSIVSGGLMVLAEIVQAREIGRQDTQDGATSA